jgi:hypothetical protein
MKSNPNRDKLKMLSAPLRVLLKEGAIDSINAALAELYESQGHHNLKTLYSWNKEGRRVKKGEHALLLWARPKEITIKKAKENGATEDELLNFFPICYVFSEAQTVEK